MGFVQNKQTPGLTVHNKKGETKMWEITVIISCQTTVNEVKSLLDDSPFCLRQEITELFEQDLICNNSDCQEQFGAYGEPGKGVIISRSDTALKIEDNGKCPYCGAYCHIVN